MEYTALMAHEAFVIEYRAALTDNRALLMVRRALLIEYMALLIECREEVCMRVRTKEPYCL